MFNKHEISRNACQLYGAQARCGYDWWWHSFTARNERTSEEKSFFIEYFLCNPQSCGDSPVFGQLKENKKNSVKPSYLMDKAGAWGGKTPRNCINFSVGIISKCPLACLFR